MSLTGIAPVQQAAPSLAAVDDPLEQARFTRWVQESDGVRLGESALQVSGMYCAACTGIIENALRAVDGVREARVSAAAQRATVRWDPARTQPSALIAAIRAAGYDAVPDAAAPAREMRRAEHRAALWRLFVASFCAMQVMMFATPSYVAGPADFSMEMRQLLNWGSWVLSIPVVLFSAGPFFRGAWRGLRSGRIGMDVPVAIGVAVTFVASTGATFDPAGVFGHEVYFDSLTMFVSFLLGGRYLELRARHRAAAALEGALARLPETAQRLEADGSTTEVSVQRLVAGDRVRVALGQAFPADGALVDGATQADESLLTGESVAVDKPLGAAVVAGSLNLGAPVTMLVERAGADTRYEAIVSMMREAMSQRPALARVADHWAVPFLWTVLLLAAGGAAVWSVIDPSRAIWVAVSVLIVTCPCALSLAAPATMVAAAGGLARRGVLLQRLDALEDLARAERVFIDKTGTLTEDRPALAVTRVFDESVDALGHAASLAAWSRHPMSQTLAAALPASGRIWQSVEEVAGEGLRGVDGDGVPWCLGRAAFAGAAERDEVQVWLSRDGKPVAAFGFDELLRPGADDAVRALQAAGVRVTLLSGDAPARAARLAARLGLDSFVGGARPEDKLAAVAAAQRAGDRVVMVGDGVNDAPVLARADVSLAMGQGALVARAQADAVLASNRPLDLVTARCVAARAMRIVRQNMIWAAAYNAACIPLALVGWLPPWAAGLGMAGSSLFVVLNALRAGR
ncbi:cation-translocating P-type ATPase [Rubrivivax sp. JA1026]|uniref:heavy metal translocating P-type ATPase n=1 Tax=Rubrivivax sp. JA1026 TaxID=2710888 RepID=UPI001F116BF3|nr:heavy metal translocating P-type ATPase [Rubrivivax sp. JA1026]